MESSPDIQDIQKSIKLENIKWNQEEEIFRKRQKLLKQKYPADTVPMSKILDIKLRRSCFGRFLRCYNINQSTDEEIIRDKLDIEQLAIDRQTEQEKIDWAYYHNFTEDCYGFLTNALKHKEEFDIEYLMNNLLVLRLQDCHINTVDGVLKNYRALKFLSLAGNWIRSIQGSDLPHNLRFLDLYANNIESVDDLCMNAPHHLLHLSLGRNSLKNGTGLRPLAVFKNLRTLELVDNDLCDLEALLLALASLHLTALLLEGNPCALCMSYKAAILKTFPRLLYLDNIRLESEDFQSTKHHINTAGLHTCALVFQCYRVIGIPKPRKDKKSDQKYYVEVSLPLLNPELELEEEVDQVPPLPISAPKDKHEKESKKKDKADKKKKKSPQQEFREMKGSFKSERQPWAKILMFPNPSIVVTPFDNDLRSLRDTFRSQVKVRVVFIKIAKPKKNKKSKKKPKNEKGAKAKKPVQEETITPKEQILNQEEIMSCICELRQVSWSDRTIDFYWNGDPKHGSMALPVEGSLRDIVYIDKKNKPKKKSKKGSGKETVDENLNPFSPQALPKVLTCQVGFGVLRLNEPT